MHNAVTNRKQTVVVYLLSHLWRFVLFVLKCDSEDYIATDDFCVGIKRKLKIIAENKSFVLCSKSVKKNPLNPRSIISHNRNPADQ